LHRSLKSYESLITAATQDSGGDAQWHEKTTTKQYHQPKAFPQMIQADQVEAEQTAISPLIRARRKKP
jgi:hypothetical protein